MSKPRGGGRRSAAPTPSQIMRRYARVTGDEPMVPLGAPNRKDGFAVGGNYMDEWLVWQSWGPSHHLDNVVKTPIGRYDPARDTWLFPSEYVKREEQAAMLEMVRQKGQPGLQATSGMLVDVGASVVDMFHPYTQKVRRQMAAMLAELSMDAFLDRSAVREALGRPDSPVSRIDNATQVYPTIAGLFSPQMHVEQVPSGDTISTPYSTFQETGAFMLRLTDLRVGNPGKLPQNTYREARSIPLAFRSEAGEWRPNLTVLDDADWQRFAPLATALEEARVANPDFSVMHCAVTYGNPYDLATYSEQVF
ncbi:MAG TPA: hypothetical protein VF466_03540 [Candidatus Saccharimonadales bacterium]